MSQPVSPDPTILTGTVLDTLDSSADQPSPSWQTEVPGGLTVVSGSPPIDSYADSLMDELFEDVDRILERGVKLSTEPAQPEFVSLQPISIPHLPPMLMPRAELAKRDNEALTEFVEMTEPEDSADSPSLDRLLLTAVGLSAVAALTSWLIFYRTPPAPTLSNAASPAEQIEAQETTRFLEYFQRSIANLDRRAEANRAALTPPSTLPTVSVPTAAKSPDVLERVYIPIYQPPQPAAGEIASTTAAPVPAPVPAPVTVAPAAPAAAPAASPVAVTLPANNVLMGIMQLGDRSAALFELNGVAQRVYIGESIGTSGWSLVSVSSQEVMVRRNGEVRSVYVGQQF